MDSLRAETGTTEPLNKRQRCEDGDANLIESCNRGEDCEGGGRSAECDGASSSPQTGAEAGPAAGREASTSGTPSAAGSQKPGEDAAKQQEQKLGRRARRRKAKPGLEAMQKLNAACRAQSPALGMEAFDELLKLQEAGTLRLKLQQYNNLMYLCSGGANWQEYAHRQDGGLDAQRVRTCFRMVVDSGFTPNEMTYTALARVAALEGDGQAALAAVKDMMAAGVDDGPKLRSFHPAMRVFASQGRVQLMEEVDRMIAEQNLDLTELEFSLLLEASIRAGSYAQVCAVLHRMSRELTALQSDTLAQLQEYFRSERAAHAFAEGAELCGRGATWQVVETQVDEQGRSCHSPHALQRIEIEPKDWQEFLKGIDQLAQSRAGSMDAWLQFLKWLQRNGPYSIVIDGANVALFNQNFVGGGFSWEQIDRLVQKLQREVPDQRPLVFLHTNRCQNEDASTPYAQAVISRLRAQRMLFATPPGCNDDWFWMYAAVKAGPRGWLISNDEMRDHIYQLLRPKYFLKWRQQHQVNFQWLSPEPTLLHPPAYSTCVQQLPDGSWMLPGHAGRWLLAKPIEAAP